jgi:hypothetical protein
LVEGSEIQSNPPEHGVIDGTKTRLAEITATREETKPDNGMLEQDKEREEEQEIGDLPDIELSDADRMLDKLYGDQVHQNPGTRLSGDILNDNMWQGYWQWLIVFPSQT